MKRRSWLQLASAAATATLSGCRRSPKLDTQAYQEDILAVIKQHAEVCASAYRNAWQKADALRAKIDFFTARPNAKSYADLRLSWANALYAYMETEGLRAPGTPTDGLHNRIQAWPIDPAKLDTVPGKLRTGLVHSTKSLSEATLNAEHQPSTGNTVIGLHALEFLIFGFDSHDQSGGTRAHIDYTMNIGHKRRTQLLKTLSNLLSADLQKLADAWGPGQDNYRAQFLAKPADVAFSTIFNGLIRACATKLEGKLNRALESGDQKDEVCNYSDLSTQAIQHALAGIQNVLTGKAPGRVAEEDEEPLLGLIAKADPSLATEIETGFNEMLTQANSMKEPLDQIIKPANQAGKQPLQAISKALAKQEENLRTAAKALGAKPGRSTA